MTLRPRRIIVAHAHSEAFVDHTTSILARLGYAICTPEEFESHYAEGDTEVSPDLRIVDERRLAEVANLDGEASVPLVLLTGRNGLTGGDDARIVGAARRPAGLHDLYRLLQLVFEDTPRTAPRIATHLPTVCRREGREWRASILSLSENGCLLRTSEPLPLGTLVDLSFELPRSGPVELRAETSYQYVPDLGLVFSAVAPGARDAIGSFVSASLLA